jgi:myosin-1
MRSLQLIADMLGTDANVLAGALVGTSLASGTESVKVHFNMTKACDARDALAKAIYSAAFDWLVQRINQSIYDRTSEFYIGVLDIYGFEIFQTNSFEQLTINFVNEKLQQIFIELTLKAEQEEYVREQIDWNAVPYFNNKPCVELIEGRGGVFALLDEECVYPKGTDESLLEKLERGCNAHAFFNKGASKPAHRCFLIQHYAGDVQYSVVGFLDKNKDTLHQSTKQMLQQSRDAFIANMFPKDVVNDRKRPPPAIAQFKNQVNGLVDTLMSCHTHYIRCIRPNAIKASKNWDNALTQNQVRYLGLQENVRVRRAGYAYRETFERFLARFKLISKRTWPKWKGLAKDGVAAIMEDVRISAEGFQFGLTKIFLREPQTLFQLEEMRAIALDEIVKVIQRTWRAQRGKAFYKKIKYMQIDYFREKKERHRMSLFRPFRGDYLHVEFGKFGRLIKTKFGDKRIFYSEKVNKISPKSSREKKTFVISDVALYTIGSIGGLFGGLFEKVQRRFEIKKIRSISMSEFSDGFFVIHLNGEHDFAAESEQKTEIVSILAQIMKDSLQVELKVEFNNEIAYALKKGKKKKAVFKKDDAMDRFAPAIMKKSSDGFAVTVAPGLPKDSGPTRARFQEQQKPERRINKATDGKAVGAKWTATALYRYEAKNAREISFEVGDVIAVTQKSATGLWQGECRGRRGAFPGNLVQITGEANNARPTAAPSPAPSPSPARTASPPKSQTPAEAPNASPKASAKAAASPKASAPKAAAKAGPKFCSNCGTPATGGKFCSSCGSPLN